ncbi:MAG: hypothetical protein ACKPHU_14840, partial [Planctomycetaceae bacterium]
MRDRADQVAVLFGDQRVFAVMRRLLADERSETARRRKALDVLVRGQDRESADVFLSAAVLDQADLQGPAIRALAAIGSERTPQVLLQRYAKLPAAAKADVIGTLVARPAWTKLLLTSIGEGQVPSGDLHAWHVRQILAFGNAELADLLKRNWGEIREAAADRQAQLADWKKQLGPRVLAKASAGNGRRVFAKTCQNCHKLFGTGGEIGPDITG